MGYEALRRSYEALRGVRSEDYVKCRNSLLTEIAEISASDYELNSAYLLLKSSKTRKLFDVRYRDLLGVVRKRIGWNSADEERIKRILEEGVRFFPVEIDFRKTTDVRSNFGI